MVGINKERNLVAVAYLCPRRIHRANTAVSAVCRDYHDRHREKCGLNA
jgi:hypothetical protein